MFNKKTLIASIHLALALGVSASAFAEDINPSITAGGFNFPTGINMSGAYGFNLRSDGTYGNMVVSGGNLASNNAQILMHTVLDAGGTTVSGQGSNRILVNGNVSGVTTLFVKNNGGAGASTDLNGNGTNDNNEGISLVQVSGMSTQGAFVLNGDYVAVGPYQYRLYAYQPGSSDASQRLVDADSDGHWDYRLQNAKASATPVTPVTPETPVSPEPGVSSLLPQASSYLVHNNALLAYGQEVIGSLHQRVGEIGGIHGAGDSNFEMNVRAFGNDRSYITDLRSDEYGHNYDQQMHGMQIGGSWLIGSSNADSNLRLGLFYANGQSKITPSDLYDTRDNDTIGTSRSKVKASSYAATVTWQNNDFYVDGVFGASDYRSDVYTGRGLAARLDSNDIFASVEVGYGWHINDYLTVQPQAQVAWHKLDTETAYDIDDLRVDMGQPEVFVWRVGARALLTPAGGKQGTALTQYVKLNVYGSEGPAERLHLADLYITTGDFGRTAEFGYGLTAAFTRNLSAYGDMAWQRDIGGPSREGWTANVGVRWAF